MSKLQDHKLLWAAKIVAALFQVPATLRVFWDVFKNAGRTDVEAGFSAFMAVLLIDVFFLAVLVILEEEERDPTTKFPYVFGAIGLTAANLWVGYVDEGIYAWMPRIGFFMLVATDLFSWATHLITHLFSREQVEQRIRNRQVMTRRRKNFRAWRRAINSMEALLEDRQAQLEYRALNLDRVIDMPNEPLGLPSGEPEELEEGIYQVGNSYAWFNPHKEELETTTAGGTGYTLQGARQARSRYLNSNAW